MHNNNDTPCAYGCGNNANYFNKKTGSGRCQELVGNCPAIKARKQEKAAERTKIREAEKAKILANPQPCECRAPGLFRSRSGIWRCVKIVASCPAHIAKRDATLLTKYGTTKVAHIAGVQDKRSVTLTETHANRTDEEVASIVATREATMLERHGVRCASQSPVIQNKVIANNLKNYGVKHTLQVPEIRQKGLDNYLEKTGYSHWANNPEVKEKKRQTLLLTHGVEYPYQSEDIWVLRTKTMLDRYGVEHTLQSEELVAAVRQTMLRKYGAEHAWQSDKIRQLYSNKNGVDHPSLLDKVKEKYKQTSIRKYGVEHPMQHPAIFAKVQASAFNRKEYILPSGESVFVQGYEHYALDLIFKSGWPENDIMVATHDKPRPAYVFDEKQKRYFPDLYVESTDHIIEIKSLWTMYNDRDDNFLKNLAKQQASIRAGHKFSFVIIDTDGNVSDILGDSVGYLGLTVKTESATVQ
jgi:ribosomal protein L37AE/L43A